MSVVGFQDFWIAGSRFYFKREAQAGVEQPTIDLGVIQPANAALEVEELELEDSDGGTKKIVDTAVSKITESYDIQCSNLNLDNLAYLFYANSPAAFSQASAEATVSHWLTAGKLAKLKDSSGAYVWGLDTIAGVYTGTVSTKTITSIDVATKTIKVTGDQTAVAGLAPGKAFIVNKLGLTNILNSRTYTIVTRTLNAGNTDLVVTETPAANETAITGQITHENAGTVYKQDVDWSQYNIPRGIVKVIEGGAITDAAYSVVYTTATLSGKRLINPQALSGQIKGTGFLVYGRENNGRQTVREFTCTIAPNASGVSADEFSSITLTVTVISDTTASVPAGRMLQYKGTVPTSS